jgi:hypothetical protein
VAPADILALAKCKAEAVGRGLPLLDDYKEGERWYTEIFIGLAADTLTSYQGLHEAFAGKKLMYMAWSARNLMELDLWTYYVTSSRRNARSFYEERLVDANDIARELKGFLPKVDFLEPLLKELDKQFVVLENDLCEAGIAKNRKYLKVSEVAKIRGDHRAYYTPNKILSKLVHPTAASILGRMDDPTNHFMCSIMCVAGSGCSIGVFDKIDAHLKTCSMPSLF